MLSNKERRAIKIEAVKIRHRDILAGVRARTKVHDAEKLIKAADAKLDRCRKESTKVKAQAELRCLYTIKHKQLRKYHRCHGNIVVADLILEPRLPWKKDSTGGLSCVVMPSDLGLKKFPTVKKKKKKKKKKITKKKHKKKGGHYGRK